MLSTVLWRCVLPVTRATAAERDVWVLSLLDSLILALGADIAADDDSGKMDHTDRQQQGQERGTSTATTSS